MNAYRVARRGKPLTDNRLGNSCEERPGSMRGVAWFLLQIDDNLEEDRSGPTAQAIAAHTYDTAQQSTTPHHTAAPHNIEKPTSSPVQGPNRQPPLTRPVHAALCEYHSASPSKEARREGAGRPRSKSREDHFGWGDFREFL